MSMLNIQSKSFTSQGKARSWEFPPNCMEFCCGEVYGKNVSQPFLIHFDVPIFSLIQCVGITQLVSGFFSEIIALYIAVHYVLCGRRGVQDLLYYHLGQYNSGKILTCLTTQI